jgi:recombination protein RecT
MAEGKEVAKRQETQVEKLKKVLNTESVNNQFKNALAENAPLFVASLIDIYASDKTLQKCEPKSVVMEALKAATLRLPINRNLGFAYIIPYKGQATMQIGYRGYLQLAQRTGQYRYINADVVCEGELVKADKLTGEVDLSGTATSDTVIGYFAHMETVSGFRKTIYWPKEKVEAHAKRYSQSYNSSYSPWKTDFDAMATKTLLRAILSKYGIMSVEMASAINDDHDPEKEAQAEVDENANQDAIDIDPEPEESEDGEMTEEEKAKILAQEQEEAGHAGPGF